MSGAGRSFVVSLGLTAAVALGGCSSSSSGIPDSKIVATLNMRKVQGNYAIDGNPFCSVSKLLNDVNEVKDASKSGRVVASRDHSVGIEIIRPFAPRCRNDAERRLTKLANSGGHKKQHNHKQAGKHGKGNGDGG
jgi:nucleotidyltransferase/DNA polymerase involved in DNA repair